MSTTRNYYRKEKQGLPRGWACIYQQIFDLVVLGILGFDVFFFSSERFY